MSLRDDLQEWTELDGAMYRLGCSLGFFTGSDWPEVKWVLWAANPVGAFLYDGVMRLVAIGVLEERAGSDGGDDEYRWRGYVGAEGETLG